MSVSVRYTGSVQGVGFRATVKGIAKGHLVSGWVRNEEDGSVRMEIQGESNDIDLVRRAIRDRMKRNIRGEEAIELQDAAGESGFEIRR